MTSPPLRQGVTRWMHSCADTSMRTFSTGLSCCQMGRRLTPLKLRSSVANGSMADLFSTPADESGVLVRAASRFYPKTDADVAHLPAGNDQGASHQRWQV